MGKIAIVTDSNSGITQAQAEEVQRQFAALGVAGVVHNIQVLE